MLRTISGAAVVEPKAAVDDAVVGLAVVAGTVVAVVAGARVVIGDWGRVGPVTSSKG